MNSWNEGYFTDSTYTYGYYRELSPNFMRWCLLLNGILAPEITEESCHCELGFGQGVAANIHAAATPGKFFGTDFNPSHAITANELAEASGADAKFFEDSFEEFSKRDDLPQFDSISLHGIWSWVSAENRRHIMEFARRHLKSGGMLYNSYNCLPGWAPIAPLRELLAMYDKYSGKGGAAKGRISEALKFVEEMLAANPAYLNLAPNFAKTFEVLKKNNPDYLAHEYLNLDWDLMYFTDVAEIAQQAKLNFAATAIPIEIVEKLNISEPAIEFLRKIENPIVKEQARDYFINRQFRKDIFVRGIRKINSVERLDKILEMRYVLLSPADNVPLKFKTTGGDVKLSEEIYRPILEFLQEDNYRPKNFAEYLKRNPAQDSKGILEAIIILVNNNNIMPCQSEVAVNLVKKSCDKLNAHICERAKFEDAINFLVSPLTGLGVAVTRFQQLFLSQYRAGDKTSDKLAASAWKIISRQGQRLIHEGKTLQTPEENLAHMEKLTDDFLKTQLPIFKALLI
ncbi:MAG: class I SAM-dependent methyltransferase [Selenomonadaceae bacterium]|nr:class I SAM-dependent methyltransferase [Selenomonadaceae bacterium]